MWLHYLNIFINSVAAARCGHFFIGFHSLCPLMLMFSRLFTPHLYIGHVQNRRSLLTNIISSNEFLYFSVLPLFYDHVSKEYKKGIFLGEWVSFSVI